VVAPREMEIRSRGLTFGDFVTILTEESMQDVTVTRPQSTDSPLLFYCNVLRESLSVDSQNIPCAPLKRRGSWVISVPYISGSVGSVHFENFAALWQESHTTLPFNELMTHSIYRLSRHVTPFGWLSDQAAAAVAVVETATSTKAAPGGTEAAVSVKTGAAAGAAAAVETATTVKEAYRAKAADAHQATADLEAAVADRNRRSLSAAENDDVILRGEFLRTEAAERFYFPSQALPKEDDLRLVDNLGNNEDIVDINRDGSSLAGAKEKHFLLDAQPLLDRKVTANTKMLRFL
jgi:hypothetical protein